MKQFPKSALGAILVLLTLAGVCGALTTRSARAATVFSNYTGSNCRCGFGSAFYAEAFSPASDFDFTGAAAFVANTDVEAQSLSLGLYSSIPGSPLWTSGTLTAPRSSATLASASYGGSPILLQTGTEYFLVLDLSASNSLNWLGDGSSSVFAFTSADGSSWSGLGEQNLQFEIFGVAPGAAIPEPAPWALLLLGFGLAGFVTSWPGLTASARPSVKRRTSRRGLGIAVGAPYPSRPKTRSSLAKKLLQPTLAP